MTHGNSPNCASLSKSPLMRYPTPSGFLYPQAFFLGMSGARIEGSSRTSLAWQQISRYVQSSSRILKDWDVVRFMRVTGVPDVDDVLSVGVDGTVVAEVVGYAFAVGVLGVDMATEDRKQHKRADQCEDRG